MLLLLLIPVSRVVFHTESFLLKKSFFLYFLSLFAVNYLFLMVIDIGHRMAIILHLSINYLLIRPISDSHEKCEYFLLRE